MKTKLIALTIIVCLVLSGCVKIEISFPGAGNIVDETTQPTENSSVVADYPSTIGTDTEKLMMPLLPDDVFSSTAEENGLAGTVYQILGTVDSITADSDGFINTIHVRTYQGDVVISNTAVSMSSDGSFSELGEINWDAVLALCPMPQEGEFCRIFAEYQGYSDKYNAPYFIYGGTDFIFEILASAIDIEQ